MAFNDLSPQAQEGLNYAANRLNAEDKARKGAFLEDGITPRPDLYANGRAYMDFHSEIEGGKWYELKQDVRRAKRQAALENPANAALAAQVDAVAGQ